MVPQLSALTRGIDAGVTKLLDSRVGLSVEQLDADWGGFRSKWDAVINSRLAVLEMQRAFAGVVDSGLDQVVQELRRGVGRVHARVTSLKSRTSPEAVVRAVVGEFGDLILQYDFTARAVVTAHGYGAVPPTAKVFGPDPIHEPIGRFDTASSPDVIADGQDGGSVSVGGVVAPGIAKSAHVGERVRVTRSSKGVLHLWAGLDPDRSLAEQVAVPVTTVVVHGHGVNGAVSADPVALKAALAAAKAAGVTEATFDVVVAPDSGSDGAGRVRLSLNSRLVGPAARPPVRVGLNGRPLCLVMPTNRARPTQPSRSRRIRSPRRSGCSPTPSSTSWSRWSPISVLARCGC